MKIVFGSGLFFLLLAFPAMAGEKEACDWKARVLRVEDDSGRSGEISTRLVSALLKVVESEATLAKEDESNCARWIEKQVEAKVLIPTEHLGKIKAATTIQLFYLRDENLEEKESWIWTP